MMYCITYCQGLQFFEIHRQCIKLHSLFKRESICVWYLGDIFSLTMQLFCHRTVKQILKDSTKIVGQTILPLKFLRCTDTVYNET